MLNMSKSLRRAAEIALLAGGCHGLPLVEPGAAVVTYPSFSRGDCSLSQSGFFPGGTLLIDSEAAFRANFECPSSSDDRAGSSSGVDFSRDLIVVFLATGKSLMPKLARLERKGDRLTAIFSVEPYCGGAPPFPITAVPAFLVRRAPLTLASKAVTLHRDRSCPKGLP